MDAKQLLDLVNRYQENREYITNEETTKMGLIVPFIRHLGYDPNSPREVRLEFAAEFTQGDGKRLPDRMDYAIFDKQGVKPLMVIEAKQLGTDLHAKSQQLARYLAQMPDLHFGILTDGCQYLFFGDLDNQNQMDSEPFFSFSLDDANTDWVRVGKFLTKFSREAFKAETLVTDAENSRYRQAMTEKIAAALRDPRSDDGFMKWLTGDVYKGKRTGGVMERLSELAKEAIEPAVVSVLEDDFLDKLKDRFQRIRDTGGEEKTPETDVETESAKTAEIEEGRPRPGIETTAEELEFYRIVRDICTSSGVDGDQILYRDTVNYFNVSYRKPTKWFIRFFGNGKRKYVATMVHVDEVRQLASGFEVEEAPSVFGASRVYIENPEQMWALKDLVQRSLEVSQSAKSQSADSTLPDEI
jgi:hypothetical protein